MFFALDVMVMKIGAQLEKRVRVVSGSVRAIPRGAREQPDLAREGARVGEEHGLARA